MSQQVFQKLRLSIDKLKSERQQLNNQMNNDRNDLSAVQGSMIELGKQLDSRLSIIRQKQRKLMQIQKAINQTQKSYQIIVQTTRKLSSALQSESSHLRGLVKK